MIDRWIDRKHRKIKRSPVKRWDITILAPHSVCREALTNSALTRQHTFYKTLAQTQSMKFHCPFLPANSNKKHIFHKGVGRETFRVYPDLDSGSSRHPYGHACVCVHAHACTCAPKGSHTTVRFPGRLWSQHAKSTHFPKWQKWVIWWIYSQLEPARSQHGVTLEAGCFNLGGGRPSWVRLRLQIHPNTHGHPVITSPMRASNSQSIYCTRCLGECFLFKTVFTSHRNLRGKVLLQRTFYSQRLQH